MENKRYNARINKLIILTGNSLGFSSTMPYGLCCRGTITLLFHLYFHQYVTRWWTFHFQTEADICINRATHGCNLSDTRVKLKVPTELRNYAIYDEQKVLCRALIYGRRDSINKNKNCKYYSTRLATYSNVIFHVVVNNPGRYQQSR